MTSDILEEIKKEILQKLPDEIQVSKVEFEGPEVVVYTKNPEIITENGDLIRSLAKELRKRIIIRSDKSAFLDVTPYFPMTSPGFLAVMTTSPVTVSK